MRTFVEIGVMSSVEDARIWAGVVKDRLDAREKHNTGENGLPARNGGGWEYELELVEGRTGDMLGHPVSKSTE
jgi:hypothetical protein